LYDSAEAEIRLWLSRQPRSKTAYVLLGQVQFARGEQDDLIQSLTTLIQLGEVDGDHRVETWRTQLASIQNLSVKEVGVDADVEDAFVQRETWGMPPPAPVTDEQKAQKIEENEQVLERMSWDMSGIQDLVQYADSIPMLSQHSQMPIPSELPFAGQKEFDREDHDGADAFQDVQTDLIESVHSAISDASFDMARRLASKISEYDDVQNVSFRLLSQIESAELSLSDPSEPIHLPEDLSAFEIQPSLSFSNPGQTQLELGDAYLDMQMYEDAIESYQKAASYSRYRFQALLKAATVAYQKDDRELYTQFIEEIHSEPLISSEKKQLDAFIREYDMDKSHI
jgi:tetratricopeptide (TPR) repeat protein